MTSWPKEEGSVKKMMKIMASEGGRKRCFEHITFDVISRGSGRRAFNLLNYKSFKLPV